MRVITFIALLVLGAGCTGPKNAVMRQGKLNGTWVPIKEELGGTVLPKAAFDGQKLVVNDSAYTFTAESVDKGVISYRAAKMDIFGREGINKGKHFTAIYKLENGELTVCYNLSGDTYPEAFDTKGKSTFFLCVFKKTSD